MAGRFLLDTNIIIAHFAKEANVEQSLAVAPEVFLPSVALGELYYGACKSARVTINTRRIDEFAAKNTVLTCDTETAREYGRIKNDLRVKGKPIPENDIWIAAIAIQYDLTLVTRDGHFNEIEGLATETW